MNDPERCRPLNRSKFKVTRSDGSSRVGMKHAKCRYFVLDLDHDKFSLPALKAYAKACAKEYPRLAESLNKTIFQLKNRTK